MRRGAPSIRDGQHPCHRWHCRHLSRSKQCKSSPLNPYDNECYVYFDGDAVDALDRPLLLDLKAVILLDGSYGTLEDLEQQLFAGTAICVSPDAMAAIGGADADLNTLTGLARLHAPAVSSLWSIFTVLGFSGLTIAINPDVDGGFNVKCSVIAAQARAAGLKICLMKRAWNLKAFWGVRHCSREIITLKVPLESSIGLNRWACWLTEDILPHDAEMVSWERVVVDSKLLAPSQIWLPGRTASEAEGWAVDSSRRGIGTIDANQMDVLYSAGLAPNMSVLEVGCGTLKAGVGVIDLLYPNRYYCVKMAPWVPQAALNGSDVMRQLNQRKHPTIFGSSECDVESVETGSLDLVFGFTCWHYMPIAAFERCLQHSAWVLKPTGKLLLELFTHADGASAEVASTFEYIGVKSTYSMLQIEALAAQFDMKLDHGSPVTAHRHVHTVARDPTRNYFLHGH